MRPISASAALTGTGLGLMKLIRIRSSRRSWSARAAGPVAGTRQGTQAGHLGRDLVGRDRDDPIAAERQQRERPGVVAREHREALGPVTQDGHDLLQVRGRLLDRDDARMLGEPEQGRGVDVAARPPGHVVDDDGQPALVRDGPVVRLQHPLVGLVVVRRHDQGGVRPEGPGTLRVASTTVAVLLEPVPAMTGTRPVRPRRATAATVRAMIRSSSSWVVVGDSPVVPHGHEAVDAQVELALDEPRERRLVERAVAREGRHERREGAPQGEAGGAVGVWAVWSFIGRLHRWSCRWWSGR